MSQDPSKSNFALTKADYETRSFSTLTLTRNPEEDEESESVENNQDASKRFELLRQQGLNPLKPVIIANTEYVPVGEGTVPDASGLKVQLSDNSVLSVNNVTKLIELHRQIRLATLNAANKVLLNAKGYDINDVLADLNRLLKTSMEELAKENLSLTVDEVIKRLTGLNLKGFSAPTSSKKVIKSSALKAKKNQFAAVTAKTNEADSTEDAIARRTNLATIFQNNNADPFLRTLVEYSILEIIIFDILQYLSGILSLKEAFSRSWSVYESLGTNTLPNSELRNSSSFLPGTQKFINFSLNTIIASIYDLDELFQTYTGVKPDSKASDITLLLQFFISIADEISNRDLLAVSRVNSEEVLVGKYPVKSSKNNLKDALAYLSSLGAASLYGLISFDESSTGENDHFDATLRQAFINNSYDQKIFNDEKIDKIINYFPSDVDDIDVFGQMLAASLINDCIQIATSTTSITQRNKALIEAGGSTASRLNSVRDYFRSLMLYDGFSSDNLSYEYDLSSLGSFPLVKFLSLKSSTSDGAAEPLPRYLPLESTTYANTSGETYLTGPEYFLDLALQRGNFDLKELNDFALKYKNFTNKFADDIYNMTKLDECSRSIKKLFKIVGNELMSSATDGNSVLLLSLIATRADNNRGLFKLFRSVYFASRLDVKKTDPEGFIGDIQRPLQSETGDRRAMRAANQILLRDLINDSFGVSRKDIKFERKRSILNVEGNQIKGAFQHDEYVNRDKEFNKIPGGKTLNAGTEEENLRKITYTVHKQSGDKFGTQKDGLNKEENVLEGGTNFSTNLCKSIQYFLSNEHFESNLFLNFEARQSFNREREDNLADGSDFIAAKNQQGENVLLGDHHRAFLLYGFVAKLISKSVSVKAKSSETDKADTAKVVLTLNADEIEGVSQAFIDVSEGVSRSNTTWNTAKVTAYQNTLTHLRETVRFVEAKYENIAALISAPVLHSEGILSQAINAKNFIEFGDASNRGKLALSVVKDPKIKGYSNILGLLTKESAGQIYKSHVNTFIRDRFGYAYEDCPNVNQLKLMIKILTTTGYGLLSSEKRGPKTICHVGVTNSLLSTLRYEAYKEFSNKNFLNTTRFCVNIFKRNEIDSQIFVYPKTFLFDSSYQIVDQDVNGTRLNHIQNFTDTWNFDEIINNIEITRWTQSSNNTTEILFKNIVESFKAVKQTGESILSSAEDLKIEKDVIINHVLDYALKIYYRYSLGIDFNENSFTLEPIRKISGAVSGGISTDKSLMQGDYDTLINQLRLRYPAANVDQKLASELFRSVEIIAANPIYSLADKLKKVIYPKKFDNVLSILVNEKDFVLYTPAYDINFQEVYKTTPNFNITPKIVRPETIRKNIETDANTVTIAKHIDNCKEDFPEVSSLYATITILSS